MFDECLYYLTIPIFRNSWPAFDSVIIQTCWKGEKKKPVCITSDRKDNVSIKDREHFGEFIFLLAAKLKYDSIRGISFNNAGFLHADHIAKLIKDKNGIKRTAVPFTIYTSLKRLARWAAEAQTKEDAKQECKEHLRFLNKVFFEPSQVWHLVCYGGNTTNMNLVWWLNIPIENIFFKDETGKTISDEKVLDEVFRTLLPSHCLTKIENPKQKELDEKLARNNRRSLTVKAKETREKELQRSFLSQFKKQLTHEASWNLKDKLRGEDTKYYQPLDLEIGEIERINPEERGQSHDGPNAQLEKHDRVWRQYNIENDSDLSGAYILRSDVGTGKTTFLRHLQLELLKQNGKIPVYIHASEIENWEDISDKSLETHIKKTVVTYASNALPSNLWIEAVKKNSILLIDGLDQITGVGTAHRNILDDLLRMARYLNPKISILIASRPIAVISAEDNESVSFLRLKPFSLNVQKIYFGKHFRRANEICNRDSKMLGIPMLAYMLRFLIHNKQDENIATRKDLYERLIEYVFIKYKHDKLSISRNKRIEILKALKKISYEALIDEEINHQQIPLEFCWKQIAELDLHIDVDDLTKHGITNFIAEKTVGDEVLLFSHQSFQEYLAAEWANMSEDRITYLIQNYWNPKYKETIKFLCGMKNCETLRTMLHLSVAFFDNQIFSRLFFLAECMGEFTNDLNDKLEGRVTSILNSIARVAPFETKAIISLINIGSDLAIKTAWEVITYLGGGPRSHILNSICQSQLITEKLFSKERLDWLLRKLNWDFKCHNWVMFLLENWAKDIPYKYADKHISESIESAFSFSFSPFHHKPLIYHLNETHISKIRSQLNNDDFKIREQGLHNVLGFEIKSDRTIKNQVLKLLDDAHMSVARTAVDATFLLIKKINAAHIRKILKIYFAPLEYKLTREKYFWPRNLSGKLDHNHIAYVMDQLEEGNVFATKALMMLANAKVDLNKNHVERIINCLNNERIAGYAIYLCAKYNRIVGKKNIARILDMIMHDRFDIRIMAMISIRYIYPFVRRKHINYIFENLSVVGNHLQTTKTPLIRNDVKAMGLAAIEALSYLRRSLGKKDISHFIRRLDDCTMFHLGDKGLELALSRFSSCLSEEDDDYIARKIQTASNDHAIETFLPLVKTELLRNEKTARRLTKNLYNNYYRISDLVYNKMRDAHKKNHLYQIWGMYK